MSAGHVLRATPRPVRPLARALRRAAAGLLLGLPALLPAAPAGPPAAGATVTTPASAAAAPPAVVCPPLPRATGAPAADRGLLWELHKDGRRSWLYGTLHVGRPDWARPGPRLAAALASSEVLALEIDPAQAASGMADAARGAAPEPLPPALTARLAAAAARACLPEGALQALPPVLQATLLAVLDARWLGLDSAYAQEHLLALQARQRGLPVVALETVAQQLQALGGESPQDTQALVARTLDQLEDSSARRVVARLAQAWERGDLQVLEDFTQWCDCAATEDDRAALRRMNDDRNPQLAAGIAARHAAGQRVFAAVGALHMTGPAALPLLLQAQGFRVQRVPLGTAAARPAAAAADAMPGSPRAAVRKQPPAATPMPR